MSWYEWVAAGAGVVIAVAAARKVVWQGLRAFTRFGEAVPSLTTLPEAVDVLRAEIHGLREEMAGQGEAIRTDLREHMNNEDLSTLGTEKVLVGVIARQEKMDISLREVVYGLTTVRQILMNAVELGAGDRWRMNNTNPDS